jgi:PKD repeat protein
MRNLILFLTALVTLVPAVIHAELPVTVTPSTETPSLYGLYELTLDLDDASYLNPFQDIQVEVLFHAPSTTDYTVPGFYYDTDTWKIRFNVREEGAWTWDLLVDDGGDTYSSNGGFSTAGQEAHGFISVSATNNLRLVWDEGSPCYPVGVQYYGYSSPMIEEKNIGGDANRKFEIYFDHWGKHGCNFYRRLLGIEQSGGHVTLWSHTAGLEKYDLDIGKELDDMFAHAYSNGMATTLVFFDKNRDWSSNPLNTANGGPCSTSSEQWTNLQAKQYQQKYFEYCINRYGPYVCIWQFFNERSGVPSAWFTEMFNHIKASDPYQHLINTTWDAGAASYQEVNAPHHYDSNTDDSTWDQRVFNTIRNDQHERPCIVDEFGAGRNNSSNDPFRWRVSMWISFMAEGGLVFWHTVFDGIDPPWSNANAYFNKKATLAMGYYQDIVRLLPATMTPVTAPDFVVSNDSITRGYATGDPAIGEYAVYLFHHSDLNSLCTGFDFTIDLPVVEHLVRWYEPLTGNVIGQELIPGGISVLTCPPFAEDIFCRITSRHGLMPDAAAGPDLALVLGADASHTFDGSLSTGATHYRWRFGDYGGATLHSPVHDFTRAGLYRVFLAVDDGVMDDHDVTQAGVFSGEENYLVYDPFQDDEMAEWFQISGNFRAEEGRLISKNSGTLMEPALTADDFTGQVDIKIGPGANWGGLCFRKDLYNDSLTKSGYLAYIRSNGNLTLFSANTDSQVASANTGIDPTVDFVTLGVVADGTDIRVSANGRTYIDWTDDGSAGAPFMDGYFGLQANGEGVVEFDDISLRFPSYTNQSPVVDLSANPVVVDPGDTVFLDASASFDPDEKGWIVLYHWNFGDGGSLITDTPSALHAYSISGMHTVVLTVFDNRLGVGLDTVVISVSGDTPTPPQFLSISESNGNIRFSAGVIPGIPYGIQASTDLIDPTSWIMASTNTPTTNVLLYEDSGSSNFPVQFYRLVPDP